MQAQNIFTSNIVIGTIFAVGLGTLFYITWRTPWPRPESSKKTKDTDLPVVPSKQAKNEEAKKDKPKEAPAQPTAPDEKPPALVPDTAVAARVQPPLADLLIPTSPGFHHIDHVKDMPSKGTEELISEILSNITYYCPSSPVILIPSRAEEVEPSDLLSSFQIVSKPNEVAADDPDENEVATDAPDESEVVADAPDESEVAADAPDESGVAADDPDEHKVVTDPDEKEEIHQANGDGASENVVVDNKLASETKLSESSLDWNAPAFVPQPIISISTTQPRAASPNGVPHGSAVKKIRCRFWPRCTNKNCKFVHPRNPCRNDGCCQFGDKCIYYHSTDPMPTNDGVVRSRRRGRGDINGSELMIAPALDGVY